MLLNFLARDVSRLFGNLVARNPLDLPRVDRRTGTWNHADIEWLANKARDVPGDFAEIGVYRGAAFRKIAALAAQQGKSAHAFDSFAGMDEPTEADQGQYPKGKFDIGGPEEFVRLMHAEGIARNMYSLWPGFVPACFAPVPAALRFSLVVLDLDHYQPTVDALQWLPPHISDNGILALDDYLPWQDAMATRAIREFLAGSREFERVANFNQQLILRKLPRPA